MRIVFLGTPDFAAVHLARILRDGHTVPGVFSQPDRPKGRGHKTVPTPVKTLALEHAIPVHQPTKLRDGEALRLMQELAPDLAVVVAYGRILPKDLLEAPTLGCINLHASLLPRLRGAAPIQWSIINGDTVTGVTSMHMAEGMDTGDIILQRETEIGPEETAGELFERLASLGADCLSDTIRLLEQGGAPRRPQDDSLATYAPMLEKQHGRLDFSQPAHALACRIRGVTPSPGAYAWLDDKRLKLHKARAMEDVSGEPGTLPDPQRLLVCCGQGALELSTVQPEGKKPMDAQSYLRGYPIVPGTRMTGEAPL